MTFGLPKNDSPLKEKFCKLNSVERRSSELIDPRGSLYEGFVRITEQNAS